MHHTLTVVITQELAGQLRGQARAAGFVDLRHYVRDQLFKLGGMAAPTDTMKPPSRLPPTQRKILGALAESGKQMCVADFIRSTGFSYQACHLNTRQLIQEGLLEVVSTHREEGPGAPKRFFKMTPAGQERLALVERAAKEAHDALQRTAERSAIAQGAAPDAIDQQEAEELRAVRAKHEARRQLEAEWAAVPTEDFERVQLALLRLVFAKSDSIEAVKAKAPTMGEYIRKRFMEGTDCASLYMEAMDELDKLGGASVIGERMTAALKGGQS